MVSKTWPGDRAAMRSETAVAAGVPKLPLRTSVAPARKTLRQVPFSAPKPS